MVGILLVQAPHLVHDHRVLAIDRPITRQDARLDVILLVALIARVARELVRRAVLSAAVVAALSVEVVALSVVRVARKAPLLLLVVTLSQPMVLRSPSIMSPCSSAPLVGESRPIVLPKLPFRRVVPFLVRVLLMLAVPA
jgi:hypothetical protein